MKYSLTAVLAIFIGFSQPVHALGEDFPQLGARILLNLTRIMINDEKLSQIDQALELGSELEKLNIESFNKAWGNVSSRLGKLKTEVQNAKVKVMSQPALNVCGAYTATIYDEIKLCDALDEAVKYKNDHYGLMNLFGAKADGSNGGSRPGANPGSDNVDINTVRDKEESIIDQMIRQRPDLVTAKNAEEQQELATPRLASTDSFLLVTGEKQFSTISESDAEVVSNFIYLIAPPFEKDNLRLINQDLTDRVKVELLQDSAKHSMPAQSLFYILEKRLPSGNSRGSYLNTIERYASKVFGPEEDTVSTAIMTSKLATPASIYRNMALLKSNRVKTTLGEFRDSLREEAILANYLMTIMEK